MLSNFDKKQMKILYFMGFFFSFSEIEISFTEKEKAFYVFDTAWTQSKKTVLHAFVGEFTKTAPIAMQIFTWYKKFKEEGCLCRAKESGWPLVLE